MLNLWPTTRTLRLNPHSKRALHISTYKIVAVKFDPLIMMLECAKCSELCQCQRMEQLATQARYGFGHIAVCLTVFPSFPILSQQIHFLPSKMTLARCLMSRQRLTWDAICGVSIFWRHRHSLFFFQSTTNTRAHVHCGTHHHPYIRTPYRRAPFRHSPFI